MALLVYEASFWPLFPARPIKMAAKSATKHKQVALCTQSYFQALSFVIGKGQL